MKQPPSETKSEIILAIEEAIHVFDRPEHNKDFAEFSCLRRLKELIELPSEVQDLQERIKQLEIENDLSKLLRERILELESKLKELSAIIIECYQRHDALNEQLQDEIILKEYAIAVVGDWEFKVKQLEKSDQEALAKAWKEGFHSGIEGQTFSDNPYTKE